MTQSSTHAIWRATTVIMVFTLLSRLSGFGREMALAYGFGAGRETDAYLVAYTVPYILFNIVGVALSTVVVPVFAEYASRGEREEAWRVFNTVLTALGLLLLVISLAGIPASRLLVGVLAPGFSGAVADLAAVLTAIMLPSLFFMGINNLLNGLLNANNIFAPPAFGPVLINLFIIVAALGGSALGIHWVAAATVAGTAASAFLQIPFLYRAGFHYRPHLELAHPGVQKTLRLMLPVIGGVAVGQVYLVIDRVLASGLAEGSISALNYASRLLLLPQSVFVLALSTAIFPALSAMAAEGEYHKMVAMLNRGLRLTLLLAVPAGIALLVLRYPLVELLFARGAFDQRATEMTALALFYFSFGMVGQCVLPLLTRGFYACQDTLTPVKVGIFSVLVNLIFSLLLIRFLQHGGLALANSIAATFNIIVLWWLLARRLNGLWDRRWLRFALELLLTGLTAMVVMAAVDSWLCLPGGGLVLLLRLMAAGISEALVLIAAGFIWRWPEINEGISFLKTLIRTGRRVLRLG